MLRLTQFHRKSAKQKKTRGEEMDPFQLAREVLLPLARAAYPHANGLNSTETNSKGQKRKKKSNRRRRRNRGGRNVQIKKMIYLHEHHGVPLETESRPKIISDVILEKRVKVVGRRHVSIPRNDPRYKVYKRKGTTKASPNDFLSLPHFKIPAPSRPPSNKVVTACPPVSSIPLPVCLSAPASPPALSPSDIASSPPISSCQIPPPYSSPPSRKFTHSYVPLPLKSPQSPHSSSIILSPFIPHLPTPINDTPRPYFPLPSSKTPRPYSPIPLIGPPRPQSSLLSSHQPPTADLHKPPPDVSVTEEHNYSRPAYIPLPYLPEVSDIDSDSTPPSPGSHGSLEKMPYIPFTQMLSLADITPYSPSLPLSPTGSQTSQYSPQFTHPTAAESFLEETTTYIKNLRFMNEGKEQ